MSAVVPQSTGELIVITQEPLCAEAPLSSLDTWVTPTSRFYIRNHFPTPSLDISSWSLTVEGEVERPLLLKYDDLTRLPSKELVSLLECAGNSRTTVQPPVDGVPWEHGAVGTARWRGVPLCTVLEQAGLRATAKEVLFEGADGGKEPAAPEGLVYAMSVPLDKAWHPDTLIVYEMNGEVLSPEHGYPIRMVVSGWYGMASVKWLTRIQVLDHSFQGHHQSQSYVFVKEGDSADSPKEPVTSMLVKSLITWPSRGQVLPTGSHLIRGVAWSGQAPVSSVEVSTEFEGQTWHSAKLLGPGSPYAWQQWEYQCQISRPGYYVIRARATDAKGDTQPLHAEWNFRGIGINSIHAVPVEARSSLGARGESRGGYPSIFIEQVKMEGLGNTSYVVGSEHSGQCAVIDPVRDIDHYTIIAASHGVRITYALETHVHNDFISGARELAAQTGCQVGASASGGLLFPSLRLQEKDEIDLGEFQLRVIHTPGHTPEHISFLVIEQGKPTAVFTGGALMLGGAARVDLLGNRVAPFLARWLHKTIHGKLLKLPDEVKVYPTHGGGSFCAATAPTSGGIPSTIGEESQHNPFASHTVEADFVEFALTGLGSYPVYYKYMADINRRGPDVLGGVPRLASLTALSARHQLEGDTLLVDARPQKLFNEEHLPGSFAVPFGDNFATWVGWVVPWAKPLILLSHDPARHDAMVRQLIRIGYDRLNGYLADGVDAWKAAGLPVETSSRVNLDTLRVLCEQPQPPLIIDVRQRSEYLAGHISGALNIELGELQEHLDGLPRELPIVTHCASGMRSTIAGSILLRDGRENVQVVDELGAREWIARGYPSATGEE